MKRNSLFFIVIVALFFILSACTFGDREIEETGGGSGSCVSPPKPEFVCEFESEQESYDINNVTLKFTYGYVEKKLDYIYSGYLYINGYMEDFGHRLKPEYEDIGYQPTIAVYVQFSSFGHDYLIKTIDDFLTEEYCDDNHSEYITIPAELFYNEYGLIIFSFTDNLDRNLSSIAKSGAGRSRREIYYKKVGETIYISDKDLAPPYEEYYPLDEQGKILRNLRIDSDPTRQDYCGVECRRSMNFADTSDFPVQLYIGRIYDVEEKNIPSVDIYIVTKKANGKEVKLFVKTINDYMSDEYLCTRTYNYYGKVREVIYNHSEPIEIPHDFFERKSGTIELCVYESGTQNKLAWQYLTYEDFDLDPIITTKVLS